MAAGKFERKTVKKPSLFRQVFRGVIMTIAAAVSIAITASMMGELFLYSPQTGTINRTGADNAVIMDRYDMHITNQVSTALDGILSIEKVYWLRDEDLVAPKPNQARFGQTDDPATLQWLLDEAAEILDGQTTLFTTETKIVPGTQVRYYLDETIFCVTWKQVMDYSVYTISEVKITHPSQFRRFLAGGEYGSEKIFFPTEMAQSVNAVIASSGDFYRFRKWGTIVYDGVVQRVNGTHAHTCYIDEKGDLLFTRGGELTELEEAQKFVDDHNIRFSLAFGPILVEDGVRCEPENYALGEVNEEYARAALAQKDELHYLVVAANIEYSYQIVPDIHTFAKNVASFDVDKAYALDGGQTAAIAMNGDLINRVAKGHQRRISDIFYFATAIPSGE